MENEKKLSDLGSDFIENRIKFLSRLSDEFMCILFEYHESWIGCKEINTKKASLFHFYKYHIGDNSVLLLSNPLSGEEPSRTYIKKQWFDKSEEEILDIDREAKLSALLYEEESLEQQLKEVRKKIREKIKT